MLQGERRWNPLALVFLTLGPDHVLWQIGLFFSRLAVVTFGGAYAVLPCVLKLLAAAALWRWNRMHQPRSSR